LTAVFDYLWLAGY